MASLRSPTIEPLLRGVVLALLLLAAATPHSQPLIFALGVLGWAVGCGWAVRSARRLAPNAQGPYFLLFAALQRPLLQTLGLLAGLSLGFLLDSSRGRFASPLLYPAFIGGSIVLVAGPRAMRRVQPLWLRSAALGVGAAAAAACLIYLADAPAAWGLEFGRTALAVSALAAAAAAFLLSFVGSEDQTEADGALVALLLGVGLWLLSPPTLRALAVVVPLALFAGHALLLQPLLTAMKWTLRGLAEQRVGRTSRALAAYRRALAATPGSRAAEEGLWELHRKLDLEELQRDAELAQMLDYQLCLARARDLLMRNPPTPPQLEDARKLLRLVVQHQPELEPVAAYWRAVAALHGGDAEGAAQELRALLDESSAPPVERPGREAILAQAWHLALLGHAEMRRRVGGPLLDAGRRFDAIAAVEKRLEKDPKDELALALKPCLYAEATEAEYEREAGADPLRAALRFDHGFCYELGRPLLEDPQRWRRGAELWRMAARGKPEKAPSLLRHLAAVARRHGDAPSAERLAAAARAVGLRIGPAALGPEAKADYFAAAKELADAAAARGDDDALLENLQIYADCGESGADTLRRIAELHEKRGDVLAALVTNERCLVYDAKHPVHLERRDRCYFSLSPEELQANWERLKSAFDAGYCRTKARSLLDHPKAGPEQVDWALHLLELADAAAPDDLSTLALLGRARLARGERDKALQLMERAHALGQATPPSGDAEDDWLACCRQLGDFYLEDGFPERALPCFSQFRKSPKSGAATVFKIGQAYERLGDAARAAKAYENAAYYGGAVGEQASAALRELKAKAAPA